MSERIFIDPADDQAYIRFQGSGFSMKVTVNEDGTVEPVVSGGGFGGGGASFPMAEGVWYDGRTATGGNDKLASEEEIEVVADTAFAQLIYIYEPCIISKVGIRPSVPATTGTLLFSLHTPSANAMVGAKVGDLGEITVTNTYDEVDPLEDTCSVSVEQGWYFIVVSGTAEVFLPFRQSFGAHSFTGPYPARDESVGYLNFGVEITSVGIESAIPADLTAATQEYSIDGVRILFQITHPA